MTGSNENRGSAAADKETHREAGPKNTLLTHRAERWWWEEQKKEKTFFGEINPFLVPLKCNESSESRWWWSKVSKCVWVTLELFFRKISVRLDWFLIADLWVNGMCMVLIRDGSLDFLTSIGWTKIPLYAEKWCTELTLLKGKVSASTDREVWCNGV